MMHKTNDGVPITIGMRVFTYDWHMGTVLNTWENREELDKPHVPHPNSGTCDAWFLVQNDNEGEGPGHSMSGKTNIYDCSRLWARDQRRY